MFENTNDQSFNLKLTPKRKLFRDGDYAVYACETTHPDVIKHPLFQTFTIVGQMQELILNEEYLATIEYQKSAKHGDGYLAYNIRTELPTTIKGRQQFLRTILSEHQANLLINHFPEEDIITLVRENKIDFKEIKGMGEHTYKSIQEKIEENIDIQEALSELPIYGISYTVIKNLMREMKVTPALLVQKVKENPYILCDVKGLGFEKVDGYALKMGIAKDSVFRINAAILFLLRQTENEGNCWIEKNELVSMVVDLTSVDFDYVKELIKTDQIKKIHVTKDVIARTFIYENELNLAKKLKKLMDYPINEEYKIIASNMQKKIEEVEQEQGFKFNKEQLKAIEFAVKHNVVLLSGLAGSGKTSVVKGIVKVLEGLSYSASALSGKAAQRIEESTGLQSSTIHRLLGATPNGQFSYDEHNLMPYVVNIGDESSMNNSILQYQFIRAIDEGNKIIMVGDIGQLPAIGVGSPFFDMIASGVIPTVELTEVHRQAQKSGILSVANAFREGKQIFPDTDEPMAMGELKDLYMVPKFTTEDIVEYAYEICEQAHEKFDLFDFQLITPLKARGQLSCKNLNLKMQTIFNDMNKPYMTRNGYDYRAGDKIIKNGNDYENGVFNGTMGKILNVDLKEEIVSVIFGDKIVYYSKSDLDQIDMAYALTVHRVQGSQFNNVLCVLDYSAFKLLNKQWVYTALTRASKKCIFVFQPKALKYAIKQNHVKRNTFLKNFLIKIFNENSTVNNQQNDLEDEVNNEYE